MSRATTTIANRSVPYRQPAARRLRRRLPRIARYLLLIVVGILFAFPFYWVILTSLVPANHVFDFPPRLWPQWDFSNYSTAWHQVRWARYFKNTFIIAIATTILVLATSVLAGYAFATMNFPGRRTILGFIFVSLIMPAVVSIVPDYIINFHLNGLNTYWVQIIPWGASTFGIFLLQQFFRGLPTELWDAARIDGCSRLRYLPAVGIPLARPVLATVALFTFLGSYNSFLWALVMTSSNGIDPGVQPIEVGMYAFIGDSGTNYNLLSAATVFTMAPVIVLFLFLQRTFVRGVTRTGLKG